MSVDESDLGDALRRLRKGRGVWEQDLRGRLGPRLSALLGVPDGVGTSQVRESIVATLTELLTKASPGARRAVLVALGIEVEARFPTLTGRRDWLAHTLPCDVRTVRREEDRGFDVMATALATHGGSAPTSAPRSASGWWVTAFRAVLRLDGAAPELFEERTIAATRPDLRQIVAAMSLPPPPGGATGQPIEAEVVHGARIVGDEHSLTHFRFFLELPHPLGLDQTHDYAIRFRVPPSRAMRPHYAFVPLLPCRTFELIVRFDPDLLPAAVWLLDGVAPRVLDETSPNGVLLRPNPHGEVRASYRGLEQGLGYGVAWTPATKPR